ncbi:(2Fe-2S) ferredoxin domain-containing protein [Aneurinibacillus sp. Ricciae_BoGa-3]|uniref:(2Fe-2S) ferredoxin domain-containing protein n=1 Tax=Aneurinibacillus sp. Ricciae_BoGa-3 TaxID=3022697 RepID=UPI00233FE6EF|nr:(2Fe-2S) ferredoxin domain-containing protein [Aneurinibacillus sp. Ricciae_BoGa-3]WCK53291.1 (2Fe-2S) ferredoxin domain-containing protein [Aneurinibacillus sp. Ricciae_BoGa-3]
MGNISIQSLTTKRQVLGQIMICSGCCCGRTDKGKPSVPVEWLKKNWKQEGLLKSIQLTITGCLGPCDLTNVVCISSAKKQIWLGELTEDIQYEALFEWAKSSAEAGVLLDLPELLHSHVFVRFKE